MRDSSVQVRTKARLNAARRQTSAIVVAWAVLPSVLTVNSVAADRPATAIVFGAITLIAFTAAGLAISTRRRHQNLAVGMLLAIWVPFIATTA